MTLPAPKHDWNFNETSGTTAADAAGGAMMVLDRPGWVPGRIGNAVRFNPKDGVRLATTTLPDVPPPWTVAAWVKREADSESATLFSSTTHALKLEQWPGTHQVGFTAYGKGDASFGCAIPLDEWTHVTVVATDSETRLYLNGRLEGSVAMPASLGIRWLGSTQGHGEFASAILDELEVFDQALTDGQVAELASLGSESTIIPLGGQWIYGLEPGSDDRFTIVVLGDRLSITTPVHGGPLVPGIILSKDQIMIEIPGGNTFSGTLAANPDRIEWSNETVWSRPA